MTDAQPGQTADCPIRILVIEDDADLNRLMRRTIERCGCATEGALTGAAGAAALERDPPDIVLLDYNLPDARAEDILARIAQLDPRPEVIVATGEGTERIAADMLHRGAGSYIIKDERFHERLTASIQETAEELRRRRVAERERKELEVRERRFHDLYEEAPLPYQSLDADGRILTVNQAWLDLLGYERDGVIGRHVTEFLDEPSAAGFAAMFEGFGRDGRLDGVESGFVSRSGEGVLVRVFGRVIRDDQGAFVRTQCILQDITALRRAEEEARERDQDYRRIVETSQEGIWVMDSAMRTTFVNPRLCEMLGYAEAEMAMKPVADFLLPEDLPDYDERMHRRRRGQSERYVRRLRTADGSVRSFMVSATPIMGDDGSFQGAFTMLSDITELEEHRRAVEREQAKTASILRAAPVGIGLVVDRVFVEVNETLCSMLGYSREELIGQSSLMVYPSREEYERVGREKYRDIELTGSGSVETRFRCKDGRILDVQLSSAILDRSDPGLGVTITVLDITERKRAERALREAVDRWQRTFDAVPDMICVLDREQRIVAANAAMEARLGVATDEMVGKYCYELVHRLGAPPDICPFLRIHEDGTQSADMNEPNLGGSFNVTVTPILDGEETFVGAVHVVRDITERVEAQREVQRSRDFLNRIINAVADPVFVKDAEHRWILVNDAECQLAGVSREAMLGKTDYDLFPEEQAQTFWAGDDEVFSTGRTHSNVEDITDASGNIRTLITTKAPHVGPDGTRYIVGISKDITELMDAQRNLERSRRQLESLFRLTQQTFETDTELMDYALDEAVRLSGSEIGYAHFIHENQVDLTLFAWSHRARELCSAPTEGKYPLDDAGIWADSARLKRPVIHNDYEAMADRNALPEGHVPIKRHMSVPVMEGDRVVMVAGVGNKIAEYDETDARDLQLYMTEVWHLLRRRQAEIELRQINIELADRVRERTTQLENMVEQLDAFAYSVSHDLRAPARQVGQFAEILDQDYGDVLDPDGQRCIAGIRKAARTMNELIDALLMLARTAHSEISREDVDLSAMAQAMLGAMREAEPERLVVANVEPGIVARCDRRLVSIVLQNLLGNAWKFTRRKPTAIIEFGSMESEGRRVFYVRDNGAGFDMAYAQRLFSAFQRFHSEGEFPGHGIGLVNVRRAVRLHGGDVWADSAVGEGATFYFTLEG